MISDHHALYYAHELTRHSGEGADRVGSALFDASVDLNPHQIEAALFHFRSPLTKGVLLADEVGLGKTIEAALILAQLWAERKRRLLIICPAALRKQWSLELRDKFNLPSVILDKKSFGATRKRGENPLNPAAILIVSYQFAMNLEREIAGTPWDLAVIDEAHKLRNCHRKSNRVGQSILRSLGSVRKVLLSATPLQNSLMEVYGLSRIIDGDLFGEPADFRRQFCRQDSDMGDLRARLALWVKRTLRNQVLEYIRYTRRLPVTIPFTPSPNERSLYDAVTDFLGRDQSYALPERQRMLVTMVVRKLLSSSSQALAGTLQTMRDRIEQLRTNPDGAESDLLGQLLRDEEIDAEAFAAREDESEENALLAEDDAPETDSASPDSGDDNTPPPASEKAVDQAALLQEIEALDKLIARARGIRLDEKTRALTDALTQGFAKMAEVGGARKVVIFTESRTTQEYLRNFLDAMPAHRGKVVLFNGSLGGPDERAIYENWLRVNRALGRVSGAAAADRRQAIIEHFRDNAEILIATESASEGVNLQFCSLLINYDLPWNPQRVEQRIGRCHRYGQKHDVVVINFLNRSNAADQRVLILLQDKFTLFTGVFGASDSVLGTLSGGIDIEREIARILSASRTPEAINAAFTRLERDCEARILAARDDARKNLLDNFDEGVAGRLRLSLDDSKRRLDRISLLFWNLTRHILSDRADFDDKTHAFTLTGDAPYPDLPAGPYRLIVVERRSPPMDLRVRQRRRRHTRHRQGRYRPDRRPDRCEKASGGIPNKVRDILGILVAVNLKTDPAGREFLEIHTDAYPYPVSYRGEYHVRSGSTKQELKGAALDRFLLRKQGRTWDAVPVPGLKVAHLSGLAFKKFRQLARESGRVAPADLRLSAAALLAKLQLTDGDYLKRAAEQLFHDDPEKFRITLPTIATPPKHALRVLEVPPGTVFARQAPLPVISATPPKKLHVQENRYLKADAIRSQGAASAGGVVALHTGKLGSLHLALLDWEQLHLSLLEYKQQRNLHNLIIPKTVLRRLLENGSWYTLFIPPEDLRLTDYRRCVARWQHIAESLLKSYADRFHKIAKGEWESDRMVFRTLHPKDYSDKKYTLDIDLAEPGGVELLAELEALRAVIASGKLPELQAHCAAKNTRAHTTPIWFAGHLFQPLIFVGKSFVVKYSALALNASERSFVEDLGTWLSRGSAKETLAGAEIYLLRNEGRLRGFGFFDEAGFDPDFLLWLVKDGVQSLWFIDPHGMHHETADSPKLRLCSEIRSKHEARLNETGMRLGAALLAPGDLNSTPFSPGEHTESDLQKIGLYCMSGTRDYLDDLMRAMLARLRSEPAVTV